MTKLWNSVIFITHDKMFEFHDCIIWIILLDMWKDFTVECLCPYIVTTNKFQKARSSFVAKPKCNHSVFSMFSSHLCWVQKELWIVMRFSKNRITIYGWMRIASPSQDKLPVISFNRKTMIEENKRIGELMEILIMENFFSGFTS